VKYADFKRLLGKMPIFSLSDIWPIATGFHRHQHTQWSQKGYIQKLKKGVYFFSDAVVDEAFLYGAAGKIYAPSYISMELALAVYGFIPESVYAITSISTRKTQTISTSIGTFMYKHVKPRLMFGYHLQKKDGLYYNIASPEKALLDYLYLNPRLSDSGAIREMRFNWEEMRTTLNSNVFNAYLNSFNSKEMNRRVNVLRSQGFHA
jgi:predicted transcriptional regulator of viral defense system